MLPVNIAWHSAVCTEQDTLFTGDETDGDAVDTVTGGSGDDAFVDRADDTAIDFGNDPGDLDSLVPQPTEPG